MSQQVDAATVEQTKQQIRALVREIAQLSKSELGAEQYYAEVMHRIVQALAAVGGAIWILTADRKLRVDCQINLSQQLLDNDSEDAVRHLRLLQHVMTSGEARLVPPLYYGEESQAGNPTKTLLVLAPLKTKDNVEGVIEVFQRPDAQPQAQQGYLRFLVEMSELISDYLKSRKLQHYVDRQSLWTQIDGFTRMIHESLDLNHTAYTIANEGRRLIACDRLSVAVRHGAKDQIEAISGQDVMDTRSNVVQLMRDLTRRVTATGEPLWYDGTAIDLPPQVESALHAYVDECHTKSIAVLPLRKPVVESKGQDEKLGTDAESEERRGGDVVGALIVEHIETRPSRAAIEAKVDLVAQHSARALTNALDHSHLFLMPVWKALGKATWLIRAQTLPKTIAVASLLLLVGGVLALYPTDFNINASAYLDPAQKREVWFNAPGKVQRVYVEHGQHVSAGELLVELEDPELEQELAKLLSERETAAAQLSSASGYLEHREKLNQAELYQYISMRNDALNQLTMLNGQIAILQTKQDNLKVHSPIGGVVTSWEVEDTLIGRPVQRGERVLELAETDGEWDLVVKMPEKRMGHITRAIKSQGTAELDVTWVLRSRPSDTYTGRVYEIYPSAEWGRRRSGPRRQNAGQYRSE